MNIREIIAADIDREVLGEAFVSGRPSGAAEAAVGATEAHARGLVGDGSGAWMGKPLAHGLKAGPLTLEQRADGFWAVRLTLFTRAESVPIGNSGVLMRHATTSSSLLLVATSDRVDALTREWLASLANLRAE